LTILSGDPLTQLAFGIHESSGVYALLLGSGISRAAQIPTGWEITLDLIRRVGLAQGAGDQADWAAWYRERTGREPDYSELLAGLGATADERRAIIHGYIEPTEADRAEGRKTPTAAHRAIAELVEGGYIKVIVTTNFDRLLESALRERGIEPTVVASVDALDGAEPIVHSRCYILKLHGDYKDARILNIETELSRYPAPYDALLDRIFDEYGLIVCGWSGDWDHALRAAIERAPNRRYSMFWAARGEPGPRARDLISHRRGRAISIADADSFFSALSQRVTTLRQTQRVNPLAIDLLTATAKRFLAKPEHRIQLDDLFADETRSALAKIDAGHFPTAMGWDLAEYRARVPRYEAIVEPLAAIAGLAGRWGDDNEAQIVLDIIATIVTQASTVRVGFSAYIHLQTYPAVIVFYAYGIGLTRAGRWTALHRLFDAKLRLGSREEECVVRTLFLGSWEGGGDSAWHLLEGLEKHRTPLSDHLFGLFERWAPRFAGLESDFRLLFDRFELLGSVSFFEENSKEEIKENLAAGRRMRMPCGRAAWYGPNGDKLMTELSTEPMKSALEKAGFGRGDEEFIVLALRNFNLISRQMRW
jgi:hypothetical protein